MTIIKNLGSLPLVVDFAWNYRQFTKNWIVILWFHFQWVIIWLPTILFQVSRCEQQFSTQTGTSQADLEAGIVPEVTEDQLRIVCR